MNDREHELERQELEDRNRKLEAQLLSLKSRVRTLEDERASLTERREAAAGESLQLMVEADEANKRFKTKQAEMARELQVSRRNWRNWENVGKKEFSTRDNFILLKFSLSTSDLIWGAIDIYFHFLLWFCGTARS